MKTEKTRRRNAPQSLIMTSVILLVIVCSFCISSVSALWSNNTFTNGLANETLTFRNLAFPISTWCSAGVVNCYNANDTNWGTFASETAPGTYSIYMNFTNNFDILNLTTKTSSVTSAGGLYCYNTTDWLLVGTYDPAGITTTTFILPTLCLTSSILQTKLNYGLNGFGEGTARIYEANISFANPDYRVVRTIAIPENTFITRARLNLSRGISGSLESNYSINYTFDTLAVNTIGGIYTNTTSLLQTHDGFKINETNLSGFSTFSFTTTGISSHINDIWFNGSAYFITDSDNKAILVYNKTGSYKTDYGSYVTFIPVGLWSNYSDFWTIQNVTKQLVHLNSTGNLIAYHTITGTTASEFTDISGNGTDLWVLETSQTKVYQISLTGEVRKVANLSELGLVRLKGMTIVNVSDGINMYVANKSNFYYLTETITPPTNPFNVSVYLGSERVFNYENNFNQTNNRTQNFYLSLNSYLSLCTIIDGYCNVPITFAINSSQHLLAYSDLLFDTFGFNENNQTYNGNVLEYSNNEFTLNITYDSNSYLSANAYVVYNGTNYSAVKSGSGNYAFFSRTITAPSVLSNTNVSFYWIVRLYNGTDYEYNTLSTLYQNISNLVYGTCNATNQIRIMNFTTYDEDTRVIALANDHNNTYNIEVKIGDIWLDNYTLFSTNYSGNSYSLCSNTTLLSTLRMDYIMQYGTSDHVTEYYNVQNFALNSSTIYKNISLYPLLTTNSQEFLIKVKDATYLPLSNVVVEIWRKYVDIGQNLQVEAPLTDSVGNTIGHFVTNDVIYTIYLKRDGELLATYNNVQVYCNVASTDCILNLNLQSASTPPESFINYRGVSYIPTYNPTTRVYSTEFTTTDGSDKKVDIYGFLLTNRQNQSVCSNSLTASSGSVLCNFGTLNGTILINVYVDDALLFSDYVISNYKKSDILKNVRYIIMAFMLPFFVLFSISSGGMAVIFYMLGLIFGIGIFALDTQSLIGAGSFLIWFIVAGIILIMKIRSGGSKNG